MTALLKVSGLTKSFGSVRAVREISFAIEEGRCVALLGPNGAGKTTTIRMLTGLLAPTAGSLFYPGQGAGVNPKSLIGYLPQAPAFYNWMSGLEYAVYAGRLCGMSLGEAKARAAELLERSGLGDAAKRRIGGYSGGMKQRLGLAQALLHRPKLLIMDEPVSALDPVGRREVLDLLAELKQETTILFSTHVLHDAEQLCDDIIIISDGQIALQGALADIRREHRRPVIELSLESDAASRRWAADLTVSLQSAATKHSEDRLLPDGLAKLRTLTIGAECVGDIVRLEVSDSDSARQLLLELLATDRVKVNQLTIGHSTLEQLFVKAVSQ